MIILYPYLPSHLPPPSRLKIDFVSGGETRSKVKPIFGQVIFFFFFLLLLFLWQREWWMNWSVKYTLVNWYDEFFRISMQVGARAGESDEFSEGL